MNTTNLPNLPTEIWDKIYDVKEAMEAQEEADLARHKALMNQPGEGFYCITSIDQKHLVGSYCGAYHNYLRAKHEPVVGWIGEKWIEDGVERDGQGLCRECVESHWNDPYHEHINYGLPGHKESRDAFFEGLCDYWL